jgi:hypothetical protein
MLERLGLICEYVAKGVGLAAVLFFLGFIGGVIGFAIANAITGGAAGAVAYSAGVVGFIIGAMTGIGMMRMDTKSAKLGDEES